MESSMFSNEAVRVNKWTHGPELEVYASMSQELAKNLGTIEAGNNCSLSTSIVGFENWPLGIDINFFQSTKKEHVKLPFNLDDIRTVLHASSPGPVTTETNVPFVSDNGHIKVTLKDVRLTASEFCLGVIFHSRSEEGKPALVFDFTVECGGESKTKKIYLRLNEQFVIDQKVWDMYNRTWFAGSPKAYDEKMRVQAYFRYVDSGGRLSPKDFERAEEEPQTSTA